MLLRSRTLPVWRNIVSDRAIFRHPHRRPNFRNGRHWQGRVAALRTNLRASRRVDPSEFGVGHAVRRLTSHRTRCESTSGISVVPVPK
jgi:hypothetical protein